MDESHSNVDESHYHMDESHLHLINAAKKRECCWFGRSPARTVLVIALRSGTHIEQVSGYPLCKRFFLTLRDTRVSALKVLTFKISWFFEAFLSLRMLCKLVKLSDLLQR